MSLLFSQVTLTADKNAETEFLVGGIPKDTDDLEGWTGYENFVGEVERGEETNAHILTCASRPTRLGIKPPKIKRSHNACF